MEEMDMRKNIILEELKKLAEIEKQLDKEVEEFIENLDVNDVYEKNFSGRLMKFLDKLFGK